MADKPSRSLVVYGDGLAPMINPSHTHLHSLSSKACCGFLTLPNAPPSETEDERVVREFAVLLDSLEGYKNKSEGSTISQSNQEQMLIPTISERFMGMRAAVLTDNASLKSFVTKLGFTVFQLKDYMKVNQAETALAVESSELLKLLGFQEGTVIEMSQFDLVFVYIGADGHLSVGREKFVMSDIDFVNSLVGSIMHVAEPGSAIGSRLHLSLVMSYGDVSKFSDSQVSHVVSKDVQNPELMKIFPRQSYTMRGETPRVDVRHSFPMLIAQWQYAVTRKDMVETFSFKDFKEHGGNLAIPADRFLHEVAFKLWKAPKYGA